MSNESSDVRILSSGRKLETNRSVNRVLSSGRCLTSRNEAPPSKRQRKSYESDEEQSSPVTMASRIQVTERKRRENEPTKKLLLQAVSDANKSVRMKLNTSSGVVKVVNPDGTTECLTTRTLAKRLKAKEPTWIDPSSLIPKGEANLGKMKIRVRNEYCTNADEEKSSNDPSRSPMEFQDDDDEDEFVVVVNNDYEATDDGSNIWMVNDYPYGADDEESNRDATTLKRKLSDDKMSDENEQQQYSPPTHQQSNQGKKPKRCRFWPDCHAGDQCEYAHPTQRCTHFPSCMYGSECLFIHPTCRFGSSCTRFECPYLHTATTPASSPSSTNNSNANVSGRTAPSTRAENSVICKFGTQCMRPNCMYTHPRMPSARNLKWVNTKWRASDDIPLLPPAPANTVYENPFVLNKMTNSKTETEITN